MVAPPFISLDPVHVGLPMGYSIGYLEDGVLKIVYNYIEDKEMNQYQLVTSILPDAEQKQGKYYWKGYEICLPCHYIRRGGKLIGRFGNNNQLEELLNKIKED